jgi:hypothetical protein
VKKLSDKRSITQKYYIVNTFSKIFLSVVFMQNKKVGVSNHERIWRCARRQIFGMLAQNDTPVRAQLQIAVALYGEVLAASVPYWLLPQFPVTGQKNHSIRFPSLC